MYQIQNFDHLLGLNGFSDNALKIHFSLYQGYVNNTNKLIEIINELTTANKINIPEYAELKRRFGWEFNGMRLHEYFFETMTKNKNKLEENSTLYKKITTDFGSFDNWLTDFKNTASARGIGWVILYFDQKANRLFNVWVNEHDTGHLADAKLILNLDVFEHAFMLDFGTKRIDYIEAFLQVIDWQVCLKRFGY